MYGRWGFERLMTMVLLLLMLVLSLFDHNMSFSSPLNHEGLALLRYKQRVVNDPFGAFSNWKEIVGEIDPCSWFGVDCSDGKVVILEIVQAYEKYQKSLLAVSLGGSLILLVSILSTILFRSSKVVSVKPWATGLSGQLQKAFVTGAPKLKRSELEAACEDFSNIIGTFSDGTVYKGTLSSGVEIAVTSTAIALVKTGQKI